MAVSPVVQMRFPPELLDRIDEARGSQSRSAFIRSAVDMLLTHGVVGTVEYVESAPPARAVAVRDGDDVALPSRFCARGCAVPAASKIKRCVPHGLELR